MNFDTFKDILNMARVEMEKKIKDSDDMGPSVMDEVHISVDKGVNKAELIKTIEEAGFNSGFEKKDGSNNVFRIAPIVKGQGHRRQRAATSIYEFLNSCGYEVKVKRITD